MPDSAAEQPAPDRKPHPQILALQHHRRAFRNRCRPPPGLGFEQRAGIGVAGGVEQRLGLGRLDHAAGMHHRHPIGETPDDAEVMGDEQHRHAALLLQGFQKTQNLEFDGDIKCCGRFVGNQQIRPVGEGHGNHGALALAARKLVGIGLGSGFRILQLHLPEQFQHPRFQLSSRHITMHRQGFPDLPADRVQRVERGHRFLENDSDTAPPHRAQLLRRGPDHLAAGIADRALAGGGVRQELQGGQGGDRFSGAGLADQSQGFPGEDFQIHPLDRHRLRPRRCGK